MRLNHALAGLAILLVSVAHAPQAPAGQGDPRTQEVRDTVERFLERLGQGDVAAVASFLAEDAFIVVCRSREGRFVNTFQSRADWLKSLSDRRTPTIFEEPIDNVHVTIDSDQLAYLRADFRVMREGRTVSSGVDQFTLVREAGAWKIAVVAYTSIPAPAVP